MATDPEIREPFSPNLGEGDLGALGVRVERRPVEFAFVQLQVVDVQPRGVHAARRDVDHAGVMSKAEGLDEQAREHERAQHVGGERHLEPVLGPLSLGRQQPRVVNEDVQSALVGGEAPGEVPHRRQVREVTRVKLEM